MAPTTNANGKRPARDTSTSARKTVKTRYDSIIHVHVGQARQLFVVHEGPMSERSPIFRTKCIPGSRTNRGEGYSTAEATALERNLAAKDSAIKSGALRESVQENDDGSADSEVNVSNSVPKVELPDTDPGIFSIYIDAVYTKSENPASAAFNLGIDPDVDDHPATIEERACINLCRLWILADYLMDSTCKHLVTDDLDSGESLLAVPANTSIYETVYASRTGSKLRQLLIDCTLSKEFADEGKKFVEEHWEAIPPDMKRDLAMRGISLASEHVHLPLHAMDYYG